MYSIIRCDDAHARWRLTDVTRKQLGASTSTPVLCGPYTITVLKSMHSLHRGDKEKTGILNGVWAKIPEG